MDTLTAVFPTVASAKAFAEALAKPGNWAKNIVQKGRTVTFEKDIPERRADGALIDQADANRWYFQDQLERVGYYGSTQSRKATLNGVKAPFVW